MGGMEDKKIKSPAIYGAMAASDRPWWVVAVAMELAGDVDNLVQLPIDSNQNINHLLRLPQLFWIARYPRHRHRHSYNLLSGHLVDSVESGQLREGEKILGLHLDIHSLPDQSIPLWRYRLHQLHRFSRSQDQHLHQITVCGESSQFPDYRQTNLETDRNLPTDPQHL